LPIIALTANAIAGAKEMYLANGFSDFISKPIYTSRLNEILKTWLPNKVEIKSKSNDETAVKQEASIMDVLDMVAEIDKEVGLSHFGGDVEIYHETLMNFAKYFMQQCDKMSGTLESGDISGFAASAHLIKSMLSTIGAMDLSQTALSLELAAKDENSDFCQDAYPDFLEKLKGLYKQLSTALQND
jgi:HPt (histidine-containing phosphotransfer) domain-containing protein